MNYPMSTKKLRALIQHRGLDIKTFAEQADFPNPTLISNWFLDGDVTQVSSGSYQKLMRFFGVGPDALSPPPEDLATIEITNISQLRLNRIRTETRIEPGRMVDKLVAWFSNLKDRKLWRTILNYLVGAGDEAHAGASAPPVVEALDSIRAAVDHIERIERSRPPTPANTPPPAGRSANQNQASHER